MRWTIKWHPVGSDVMGTVSVEADSEQRARHYFEFHNPRSVIVSITPAT